MAIDTSAWSRRRLLKTSAALGAGLATPHFFVRNAWSQDQAFCNNPSGSNVVLGFNVPQSGPYADEGADEHVDRRLCDAGRLSVGGAHGSSMIGTDRDARSVGRRIQSARTPGAVAR